ncbi:MAG: hypothetical protein FWD05_08550 [Oscillospiraceae bacterium]|nr:hypothetical protein [Oscillospiraceae bacterium]
MPRYVPKTYNNRRILRIIVNIVITVIVSVIVLFLTLFFILESHVVDGELEIPWLVEDEVEDDVTSAPIILIDNNL